MATDALPLGAMQRSIEQMPFALQAESPEVVDGRPPRREIPWEVAPRTAAPHHVEDGVEDAAKRVRARSASPRQGRKMALDAGPLCVGEVAWV